MQRGKAYEPYFRPTFIIIEMKKIINRIGKGYLGIVALWIASVAVNGHINALTIITGMGVIGYIAYKVGVRCE